MRILGIDPGIGTTGWSVVEPSGHQAILEAAGTITTTLGLATAYRLAELCREIRTLIKRFKPREMAVERLFFSRNVTTALKVSEARGIVLLAAAEYNLPIYEYTPLQVKLAVTGYGKATKQQVGRMLLHHVQGAAIPNQDDAADAVAVAVTHVTSRTTISLQNLVGV
ncbi:crossover junction endodeoxyribonuclease RuvC [Candidatus Berkelbacteria bacterium]|nr:crossover junction endodeoxyribonuclease RuvC [Candidatus Berkelbacteria bacterium]